MNRCKSASSSMGFGKPVKQARKNESQTKKKYCYPKTKGKFISACYENRALQFGLMAIGKGRMACGGATKVGLGCTTT